MAALVATALLSGIARADITASATTPTNVVASPTVGMTGAAWKVYFDYTVTVNACPSSQTCPTLNEWLVLRDGSVQTGSVPAASLDGYLVAEGTNSHTSHGNTQSYHVEANAVLDGANGVHTVKVAVRPILNDETRPWMVKTINVTLSDSTDGDGDGVPNTIESELCGREIYRDIFDMLDGAAGSCPTTTNYVPPLIAAELTVPRQVTAGPDADQDDFPAAVTVYYETIRFTNGPGPVSVSISPGGTTTHPIDVREDDPNWPAISVVCVPLLLPSAVGLAGGDDDNDGFPETATVSQARICHERRVPATTITPVSTVIELEVDPNDNDANNPVQSVFYVNNTPVGVAYHPDADDDGIPAGFTETFLNLRFDRTTPTTPPQQTRHTSFVTVDPNDNDRNNPVPILGAVDPDEDLVPTGAEAFLCTVENQNDALDGTCTGTNYHPPSWYQMVIDVLFGAF